MDSARRQSSCCMADRQRSGMLHRLREIWESNGMYWNPFSAGVVVGPSPLLRTSKNGPSARKRRISSGVCRNPGAGPHAPRRGRSTSRPSDQRGSTIIHSTLGIQRTSEMWTLAVAGAVGEDGLLHRAQDLAREAVATDTMIPANH